MNFNQSTMYKISPLVEDWILAGRKCFWNQTVKRFGCVWEDVSVYFPSGWIKYYVKSYYIIPA